MKLEYNKYCFDESMVIDGKEINEKDFEEINIKLLNFLSKTYGNKELFKILIQSYGDYTKTEKCDQCGDYNTIIEIEIDEKF